MDIDSIFDNSKYILPDGKKIRSTKNLTIGERLHIALNRVYNNDTGEDGITRRDLASLFDLHASDITNTVSGRRRPQKIISIFIFLFKKTGLPYKDLSSPSPRQYHKDMPASLRKYKLDNDL